ncbi:MAG: carboxymuconolactone decarboxylase family protein [Myxococcota bacterium]
MTTLLPPDVRVPWFLRPLLVVTRWVTGKDPLPARMLTLFPKGALSVGVFEAFTAGAGDLDARVLSVARITASLVGGCPFCLDMNAAAWKRNGLGDEELRALLAGDFSSLSSREATAGRYARALSRTPVELDEPLRADLVAHFSARERVVLAHTIAQVNYWTRFNQGLDIPAAGFFDESVCRLPVS